MKRAISVLVMVGLLVGSVAIAADAKRKPKKVSREAQGSYQAPATVVGNCTQTDGIGCMTFATGPKESYVTAKATDAHGQPVLINVAADLDGDSSSETDYGTFCGETTEAIKIEPGAEVIFWVAPLTAAPGLADCHPGLATQGTLDVVFSNLP